MELTSEQEKTWEDMYDREVIPSLGDLGIQVELRRSSRSGAFARVSFMGHRRDFLMTRIKANVEACQVDILKWAIKIHCSELR